MSGRVAYNKLSEFDGLQSTTIQWGHRQNFNLSTSLNLDFNYASQGAVNQRNSFDPTRTTQQITSAANFSKRFWWGAVQLGGNRRQNLSDNSVSMELPSLAISPKPLDIGRHLTWSPGLTMRNSLGRFPLSPTPLKVDRPADSTVGTRTAAPRPSASRPRSGSVGSPGETPWPIRTARWWGGW
jgi:hypothetical protein